MFDGFYKMVHNIHNWTAMARVFPVFTDPLAVLNAILTQKRMDSVNVRTPSGIVRIHLRNFESLKTTFSVFCRADYPIDGSASHRFLDIGANVGVAAIFFLTRNPGNTVKCYEPDRANLVFLRKNLAPFGARARLIEKAVGSERGSGTLFMSEDGKYTSLMETDVAVGTDSVEIEGFADVLDGATREPGDVILKIDIEGLETALVESVEFERYPNVSRIFVESLECSQRIARPHERRVRSGYVEDLQFR